MELFQKKNKFKKNKQTKRNPITDMDVLETRKYKRKQNQSCAHNARFAEDING